MVMPLGTLKFKCMTCGWSTIHHYNSDCVNFFPPSRCQLCGGKITSKKAGLLDILFTPKLKLSDSIFKR